MNKTHYTPPFGKLVKICSLIIFSLFLMQCGGTSAEERGRVGTSAPDFKVKDINGNQYALKELKGKVVVLNFWFIKCPPCIREIPELNNLVNKYNEEDVVFLALARDSKGKLKEFLNKTPFNYNIVANSRWMTRVFKTHGFPTNLIIDSKGKIVFHEAAYDPERVNQMDEVIVSLI